jgi:hypothetical protein
VYNAQPVELLDKTNACIPERLACLRKQPTRIETKRQPKRRKKKKGTTRHVCSPTENASLKISVL